MACVRFTQYPSIPIFLGFLCLSWMGLGFCWRFSCINWYDPVLCLCFCWLFTFINFYMLNYLYIHVVKPTFSWDMKLLMIFCILHASILLGIFASMFIKRLVYSFLSSWVLSGFGMKVLFSSKEWIWMHPFPLNFIKNFEDYWYFNLFKSLVRFSINPSGSGLALLCSYFIISLNFTVFHFFMFS